MKLTGGSLRSRTVPGPRGANVRPTPGRVKESLFSILAPRLAGARVLDLFAGTGALGLEALSRGAAFVTFVESDRKTAQRLRETIGALDVKAHTEVFPVAAERAVTALSGVYDLVFADPPYALGFPDRALHALVARERLAPGALVVYEHHGREHPPTPGFRELRAERYGDVALSFLEPDA